MKLLNWGAQILVIASGEIPVIPANIALVKNWTIRGSYWGNYEAIKLGAREEATKELLSWFAKGLLGVHISRSYKIQEANHAFSDIRDQKVIGKVMITIDDPKSLTCSLQLGSDIEE